MAVVEYSLRAESKAGFENSDIATPADSHSKEKFSAEDSRREFYFVRIYQSGNRHPKCPEPASIDVLWYRPFRLSPDENSRPRRSSASHAGQGNDIYQAHVLVLSPSAWRRRRIDMRAFGKPTTKLAAQFADAVLLHRTIVAITATHARRQPRQKGPRFMAFNSSE